MKFKQLLKFTLMIGCIIAIPSCTNTKDYLKRTDWSDDVKTSLNSLISTYGNQSKDYKEHPYVVFDFDNTTSIFDVEEQLAIYQLQTMSFAFSSELLPSVLATDLSNLNNDLTSLGYGNGSYNDWILDIKDAYDKLSTTYGPFSSKGVDKDVQSLMQKDSYWQEFATKMRILYDLVYDNESSNVAYPWITYWFTGMSEDEVYNLAVSSHKTFKDVETSTVSWNSPNSISSRVGAVNYTWTSGIQVTENIKELWKAFSENGIDVWVCSASNIDVVRAAVDVFGLHDYCTGVVAMTNTINNNVYSNSYDYTSGVCQYAKENNKCANSRTKCN